MARLIYLQVGVLTISTSCAKRFPYSHVAFCSLRVSTFALYRAATALRKSYGYIYVTDIYGHFDIKIQFLQLAYYIFLIFLVYMIDMLSPKNFCKYKTRTTRSRRWPSLIGHAAGSNTISCLTMIRATAQTRF